MENGTVATTDKEGAEMKKEIVPLKPSMLQNKIAAMIPKDITEAIALAKIMSESTLVPKEFQKNIANCTLAIGLGGELGLSAFQAVQSIMVVNGRPTLWGDAMPGLIRASGKMEYLDETYDEKTKTCVCRVKRVGEPEIIRTFSEADATAAGLTKKDGPWQTYRKRMLQMRARSWALRDGFADILKGLQMYEEVVDYVETTAIPVVHPKVDEVNLKTEPTPENPVVDAKPTVEVIGRDERLHIFSLLKTNKVSQEAFKTYLKETHGIDGTDKMPSSAFSAVCAWITGEPEIPFGE